MAHELLMSSYQVEKFLISKAGFLFDAGIPKDQRESSMAADLSDRMPLGWVIEDFFILEGERGIMLRGQTSDGKFFNISLGNIQEQKPQ